jgi:hypothetical protein
MSFAPIIEIIDNLSTSGLFALGFDLSAVHG